MSSDDLEQRAADLERRATALERIGTAERRIVELEAARVQPWWRQAKVVTGLSAIISATIPVTTFVSGWIQKERELALNEQLQGHKIRWDYVKEALDPVRSEPQRALVFTLLERTGDAVLSEWARARRVETEQVIATLQADLAEVASEREALAEQLARLQAQATAVGAARPPPQTVLALASQQGQLVTRLETVAQTQNSLRERLGLVVVRSPAKGYAVVLSNDGTCGDAQASYKALRDKLVAKLVGFDPALLRLHTGSEAGQSFYVTAYGGEFTEAEARVIRAQLLEPDFRADTYVSAGRTFRAATDCAVP